MTEVIGQPFQARYNPNELSRFTKLNAIFSAVAEKVLGGNAEEGVIKFGETREVFAPSVDLQTIIKKVADIRKKLDDPIYIKLPSRLTLSGAVDIPNETYFMGGSEEEPATVSVTSGALVFSGESSAFLNTNFEVSGFGAKSSSKSLFYVRSGKYVGFKNVSISIETGVKSAKEERSLILCEGQIEGDNFMLHSDSKNCWSAFEFVANANESDFESSLRKVSITEFDTPIRAVDCAVYVDKGVLNGKQRALEGDNARVTLKNSSLNAVECLLLVTGPEMYVFAESTAFEGGKVGCMYANKASGFMRKCSFSNMSEAAVRCQDSARVSFDDFLSKNSDHAFEAFSKANIKAKDLEVEDCLETAVVVKGSDTEFHFTVLNATNNNNGVLHVSGGGKIVGKEGNFSQSEGIVLLAADETTRANLENIKITGGETGFLCMKNAGALLKKLRLENLTKVAGHIADANAVIEGSIVNQTATGKGGFSVSFKKDNGQNIRFKDVKMQKCDIGVRLHQQSSNTRSRRSNSRQQDPNAARGQLSKSSLDNCAFVKCDVALKVDGARANVSGCSFIMSNKHAIEFKNLTLITGADKRKESKLEIRWPNYVEPFIVHGDALSNDSQFLSAATKEKAFCGSTDFEPVMHLPILTLRITQAKSLFRNTDPGSRYRVRVIMRSVSHMLILLKQLPEKLLKKDLLDDPGLGMFAATFKLYEDKQTATNTLVKIDDLFESWKDLTRTRLYDQALTALDEAFAQKHISMSQFDDWVTILEENQRKCFVNSKYNRRRDYLLQTAKENPLKTWYFLDKESSETSEGRMLRKEVLTFLARDAEENRLENVGNFHASWVAQWAVNLLGDSFLNDVMPKDSRLRYAWANAKFDKKEFDDIYRLYKSNQAPSGDNTVDPLIKFETYTMVEKSGQRLSTDEMQTLSSLFGNSIAFAGAMQHAAKMFKGEGALPGFLRRLAETPMGPEKLLGELSAIQDEANSVTRDHRRRVVLAVMSHFLLPDSTKEPEIYKRVGSTYEGCDACFVQKLQPWNELKLGKCKYNHRYCRNCMKESMSAGDNLFRGICPGIRDDGGPCPALATRREMEMANMDRDVIYNIIAVRVDDFLNKIPGWERCDAPGCIGGKGGVTKSFFTCVLCKKMVAKDGGMSDPTVEMRLLKG
eukprot:snap_masked-scaffold_7-processed-gene-14.24-mRNA-1 protein AED:1.00 eAED:1.00 QI:0/0/0/0/1/1/2/0/1155